MSQGTFDPSKRRLCPDGACIGVLGDDGRCRTCGRASDGSGPPSAFAAGEVAGFDEGEVDADLSRDDHGPAGATDGRALAGAGDGGAGGFRPDRPLCSDGSCVGVIGAEGYCSVCGRAGGG